MKIQCKIETQNNILKLYLIILLTAKILRRDIHFINYMIKIKYQIDFCLFFLLE